MRPTSLMLLPAVALVAQAPATTPDLAKQFNAELPGINQMLKELKYEDALAKVQTLIPAERPVFDTSSAKAIAQSLDNAQGLMSLYRLYANVATENGQWEKALEIQETRAQAGRAILADLDKAQAPFLTQWKKVAQDSGDYVAKNTARLAELTAAQAQKALAPAEQQELDQINTALPVHKQNMANAPKVFKMLGDNQKEVADLIKAADEAIAKAKAALAGQNGEINEFNMKQVIKGVKVVGKKNWVDAVLHLPENVTKLPTAQAQGAFLNRMLVLDPGNERATKALANLKQGKELFPKEVKHTTKKAVSKKKK
ncbi:MAG TPA: hypothetical protein VJ486_13275 [Geothrix sp.]|nr:hypothetical protein [Geothrix sp.]